ncbi:MAG: TolC family protein, partial [Bacteroidetes bacterium]|nr:TolC family protein [Bacteroidota bacterium]
ISLQSNELKQKIAQTKMDVAKLEQEFRVLLKTNEPFTLQAETILVDLPKTTVSSSHPFLEIQKNEISNANALLSFQKAAWAPNFKIGFNSMTFVGLPDANGTILGSSTRFSSFLVGFDLPLFFHTQLNEVKMAKSMVQIKEKMAQEQVLLFNESKTQAHLEMLQLHEQVETYTSSTLEQLKTQQSILETQLNTGSISLVEWTWLVKLSLDAQMNYFEVVKRYTKAVTEFEFLNTEESEK